MPRQLTDNSGKTMSEEQMKENLKAFEDFCGLVFQVSQFGEHNRSIVPISPYIKSTGIPRAKLEAVCQAMDLVIHPGRGQFGYDAGLP